MLTHTCNTSTQEDCRELQDSLCYGARLFQKQPTKQADKQSRDSGDGPANKMHVLQVQAWDLNLSTCINFHELGSLWDGY